MLRAEQDELLKLITTIGLTVFDTVLYLDTHPTDRAALDYYDKFHKLYQEAVNEYTTYFGPLKFADVHSKSQWTWIDMPWPWEGVK